MQHRVIFWYNDGKSTTYEPNIPGAYRLLRYGRYVQITEDRLGTHAGKIVSYLLQLGYCRLEDIEKSCMVDVTGDASAKESTTAVLPNGIQPKGLKENGRITRRGATQHDKIHHIVDHLLDAGLISITHGSSFRSEADNRTEVQKEVPKLEDCRGNTKRERENTWEQAIQDKLDEWAYGTATGQVFTNPVRNGRKRPLEDAEAPPPSKKSRPHDDVKRSVNSCGPEANEDTVQSLGSLKVTAN